MITAAPAPSASPHTATLASACLSMAAIAMSIAATAVSLSQVRLDGEIGLSHLQWVQNGFILSFAALLLPCGSLADRFGQRPIFLAGGVTFALATVMVLLADSFTMLLAGRIVQGGGAALLAASGPAALSVVSPADAERRRAFGYLGASGGIGLTLGAFLGGALSAGWGWRSAFALHLPLLIAMLFVAARGFGGTAGTRAGTLDWLGTILSCVCVTSAMLFGITGAEYGWSAPPVVLALTIALTAGTAFVLWERRHPAPLLDLSALSNRQFTLACGLCLLFTTAWVALFIYVPFHLRTVQGRSGLDVGITLLALMLPALIMPLIASRLTRVLGMGAVLAGGFTLMTAGSFCLFVAWSGEIDRTGELIGLLIAGTGAGSLYSLVDYLALTALPQHRAGMASGALNLMRLAGDALGAIVPGAVVIESLRHALVPFAATLPRELLNELAAGRFEALIEKSAEGVIASEQLMPLATHGYAQGMALAMLALAVITGAGVALLLCRSLAEARFPSDVGAR